MLKAKHFLSPNKNLPNFEVLGAWRSGGMRSSDFYCKRYILAWIHVVRAILQEIWQIFDLDKFSLNFAFNIRGHKENTPYSSSEPNKSGVVNRQSGLREIEIYT